MVTPMGPAAIARGVEHREDGARAREAYDVDMVALGVAARARRSG